MDSAGCSATEKWRKECDSRKEVFQHREVMLAAGKLLQLDLHQIKLSQPVSERQVHVFSL